MVGPGAAELLVRALACSPALPLVALDPTDRVIVWNPAAERLFGWAAHEVRGRPVPFLLSDPASDRTGGPGCAPDDTASGVEIHVTRKDAAPVDVVLSAAVLRDPEGRPAGRVLIFQDASEYARRRAALMERLVDLSDALNRPLSTSQVVAAVGSGVLRLGDADRAAVFLRDGDGQMTCPWAHGLSRCYVEKVLASQRDLPAGRLLEAGQPCPIEYLDGGPVQGARPFLFPDIAALPPQALLRRLAEEEGYRALGIWPLLYEGRILGVVTSYYDRPRVWTPRESEVFSAFCRQAATALENARLHETQSRRTAELEGLLALGGRLRAAESLTQIYRVLAEETVRLLRADGARLALLSPDRTGLTRVWVVGTPSAELASGVPLASSVAGRVVETDVPYVSDHYSPEGIGPLAVVPLRSEQGPLGTLGAHRLRGRPPFSPSDVRILQGIAEMGGTAIRRARLYETLEDAYIQMVLALARTVDARDHYTAGHSERMAAYAERLARALSCSPDEVRDIRWAALLHDIGKLGIPDHILKKPGPLTGLEWSVMRQHPVIGEEILRSSERMSHVARIVRAHQERWDGCGYPDGLRGPQIPLGARILAVVDAYTAMTEDRPYQKARSPEAALEELRRCAGTAFDPDVVAVFRRVLSGRPTCPPTPPCPGP